jgi:hypothetical protein
MSIRRDAVTGARRLAVRITTPRDAGRAGDLADAAAGGRCPVPFYGEPSMLCPPRHTVLIVAEVHS